MSQKPVHAASNIPAAPSVVVDPAQEHEVALIYSRPTQLDATRLARLLREQGHQTRLVPASPQACAEALQGEGPPLLLVAAADELDTPVLRSRLAREVDREHAWVDRTRAGCAQPLFRQVCARMKTLRCEETIEAPIVHPLERAEENVVDISTTPAPVPTPAPARSPRAFRPQLLIWPLVGAMTTALGMLAFRPSEEAPAPVPELSEPAPAPAVVADAPDAPKAPPVIQPTRLPPPPPPPPPQSAPSSEDAAALRHERVTSASGYLVYAASERARDWYSAMNLCRGRTHAGVRGWTTPSSKQLNVLAKARVLPDGAIWSRTRALKAEDVAFVVHGRAGTARTAIKSETLDMAVCVRKQEPTQ
ncbi:MAG: hypothetical protein ACRBN8_25925 [Nannocystales bacterium]